MSLLTQFYNCGGGSSDGGTSGPGAPTLSASSLIFTGVHRAGAPSVTGGTVINNSDSSVYSITPGATFSGGAYGGVVLNNGLFGSTALGAGVRYIVLNGSYMPSLSSTSASARTLTGIYGTGAVRNSDSTANMPKFTTWSTGIAIVMADAGASFALTHAALDATSVNHIITSIYNNNGDYNAPGSINLSGGTSAGTSSLTPEAIVARDALVAAGFTITLNP